MSELTPEEFRAKYGMNNPPDPDNPIAKAALDAERVTAGAHGRDNSPLFDPAWSPEMWDRVNRAVQELQNGLAKNTIRLVDNDNLADLSDLPDDAVVVWRVGSGIAGVGRSYDQTEHIERVEWFTSVVQLDQETRDYWRYTSDEALRHHPADFDMRCNINLAPDCTAPLSPDVDDHHGGTTRLMVVHRGHFVLLFRCCTACEEHAGRTADTNYKNHVIEARADLPRGAIILPNPEKPTDPDDPHYSAWA
jgi:hypothetical protein